MSEGPYSLPLVRLPVPDDDAGAVATAGYWPERSSGGSSYHSACVETPKLGVSTHASGSTESIESSGSNTSMMETGMTIPHDPSPNSTTPTDPNNESRCFIDAQVIRQHGFANDSRYETAAELYFGLAPDFPLVLF